MHSHECVYNWQKNKKREHYKFEKSETSSGRGGTGEDYGQFEKNGEARGRIFFLARETRTHLKAWKIMAYKGEN